MAATCLLADSSGSHPADVSKTKEGQLQKVRGPHASELPKKGLLSRLEPENEDKE